jgi:hypothetical protein
MTKAGKVARFSESDGVGVSEPNGCSVVTLDHQQELQFASMPSLVHSKACERI